MHPSVCEQGQLQTQAQFVQVLGGQHMSQQARGKQGGQPQPVPWTTFTPNRLNPKAWHTIAALCRNPRRDANRLNPSRSFASILSSSLLYPVCPEHAYKIR